MSWTEESQSRLSHLSRSPITSQDYANKTCRRLSARNRTKLEIMKNAAHQKGSERDVKGGLCDGDVTVGQQILCSFTNFWC